MSSPSRRPKRPLTRRKKIAFAALTLVLATTFALALGESAARWSIEGSFLEAIDSITGLRCRAQGDRQ